MKYKPIVITQKPTIKALKRKDKTLNKQGYPTKDF